MGESHNNLLRLTPIFVLICLLAIFGPAVLGAEHKVAVSVEKSGEAFIVDATVDVGVSQEIAWEVMTDFDHMTSILENLTTSKIISCHGNIWIIRQEGIARYGLLSFPFESKREVRLEPMKRIQARTLSGTMKRMDDEATIISLGQGVQINYHVEIVVDSLLLRLFGLPFFRYEVEKQFQDMAKEMTRRRANFESFGKQKQMARQDCQHEMGT